MVVPSDFKVNVLEDLTYIEEIGQGAFGDVTLWFDHKINNYVAIKQLYISHVIKNNQQKQVMREKEILTKLN